jgi:hypothetical protein
MKKVIETVTKFETSNGTRFSNEKDADHYEHYLEFKRGFEAILGKPITNLDFLNGDGFIQHSPVAVREMKKLLHAAASNWLNRNSKSKETYSEGWIGRYLNDSDSPYYTLWSRLQCIDDQNREWGQPYYALNPGSGKPMRLR